MKKLSLVVFVVLLAACGKSAVRVYPSSAMSSKDIGIIKAAKPGGADMGVKFKSYAIVDVDTNRRTDFLQFEGNSGVSEAQLKPDTYVIKAHCLGADIRTDVGTQLTVEAGKIYLLACKAIEQDKGNYISLEVVSILDTEHNSNIDVKPNPMMKN